MNRSLRFFVVPASGKSIVKLLEFHSTAELRSEAARYDDLWRRSPVTLPTARAEATAKWIEHFAPRARFVCPAVEDGGRLVAALPLVGGKWRGLAVGMLPVNCWCGCGDLLVDADADAREVIAVLADGIRRLPWPVIDLHAVHVGRPDWAALLELLHARRHAVAIASSVDVGLIDVAGDWPRYEAALSSNHRRAVRKNRKKLAADGFFTLRRHREMSPDEAEALLRAICNVEDRSWKGAAGTSILRTQGIFDYFRRQARDLAAEGELEIFLLEHRGRAIAADFGYFAKGVFHSHKIGYDEAYRRHGPGRLLRAMQLELCFADASHRLVDTLGVLSEANAKWATRSYRLTRAIAGTGGPFGNAVVTAGQSLRPLARRLTGRSEQAIGSPQLGAADFLATGT